MIAIRLGRPGINIFDAKKVFFFLWLFLLVFPKGGIKIGEIPITWGYLLLGATTLYAISRSSWEIQHPRIEALLCLLPFQIISLATIAINGIESLAWTIAFLISFFYLPYAFLLLFSKQIERMDLDLFLSLFKKGATFIAYYGLFLFIYKSLVGRYLEIPFLTVNWGDLGMLDNHKCNNRGVVSKLISTYNNGQLFGITMIMLLPLYTYIQKKPAHRFFFKLALFFTLCRTVWIGLFINEIFFNLCIEENKIKGLRRFFVMLLLLAGLISFVSLYYGFSKHFFFDSNLGGRREQLEVLGNCTIFSYKPFNAISEMVYLSILDLFGIAGLAAYLIGMVGPIVLHLKKVSSKIAKCLILGLINYLFISGADGAVLFIPVLAVFWFLVSLLARKNL